MWLPVGRGSPSGLPIQAWKYASSAPPVWYAAGAVPWSLGVEGGQMVREERPFEAQAFPLTLGEPQGDKPATADGRNS